MLPKLLLYVTTDELRASRWQRGALLPGPSAQAADCVFRLDSNGLEAFGAYLARHPGVPAYLIADLVEEEFQRQLLPHVGGRAGRHLVERRLAQLYRDTPFRHADLQQREPGGRRDDHALFSALSNPSQVQPWLAVLEQQGRALAAVYSAAYLSALLVQRLAMVQEHLLLITEQGGALRQSYFEGAHLKFSRLTALAPGEDVVAATARETTRMHQFLTSTRQLERGGMLQVAILAPARRIAALEAACEDNPELSYHFLDLGTAAARCKLPQAPDSAEPLLLHLVGARAPASQYALPSARRFYRIWQARAAINALTCVLALGGALWMLAYIWSGLQDDMSTKRLLADAARDDERYRIASAGFPPSAVPAADMKAAVQTQRQLLTQSPAPADLIALVSRALGSAPAIELLELTWRAGDEGVAGSPGSTASAGGLPGMAGADATQAAPILASTVGLPTAPVQSLRIAGEIDAAATDYRAILDSVNQFALAMSSAPGVKVEITDVPVDVRQNVRLSGKADDEAPTAKPKFSVRVLWQP